MMKERNKYFEEEGLIFKTLTFVLSTLNIGNILLIGTFHGIRVYDRERKEFVKDGY